MMQIFSESDVKFKGDFKLAVETPAGKDGKPGDLKVDGSLNFTLENLKGYLEKATAAGLPAGKNSALKFNANLTDGGRVKGSLYAYNDAKGLEYYKRVLVETLKKLETPPEQIKLAEEMTINGAQVSVDLSKDGLKAAGFLETSPLTAVVKAGLTLADKNFSGEPSGFSVSGKTEKDQMNVEGRVYIAKLLEGKSAADIKEAMGLEVKEGAKPEDVKMVAIDKPEVKIAPSLVAIQTDGKKLLAAPAVAIHLPGMGDVGGSGGSNLMLIIGGLIAAIVVGAGIAAGRKKS